MPNLPNLGAPGGRTCGHQTVIVQQDKCPGYNDERQATPTVQKEATPKRAIAGTALQLDDSDDPETRLEKEPKAYAFDQSAG